MRLLALALVGMSLAPSPARADVFRADGSYDPTVPTQERVLGFAAGARAASHAEIVRYAEALAEASPRVQLTRYGRTHEGRDLVLLAIAREDHLAELGEIRGALARLADPRRPLAAGELERLLDETPAVAFLAHSIHGDEFSGADAALRLAYELAAGQTDDVRHIRDEVVVLIDPLQNPDGRARVLSMIATYSGRMENPDPEALSHQGVWPWGRANHYLFDLNRDWFVLVHPETRGKAKILRDWNPQLVVDAHEMGSASTFLFNPPREPFNPHLPSGTLAWWERFAEDQARAFDARGWSYYTREWNEEFFPGYGSSAPLYRGAVGILYEQASSDAQPVRRPHGDVDQYADTVARQFVSAMANLGTVARTRRDLLASWRGVRDEAIARGRRGPLRTFYFGPGPDPRRSARLATRLSALGIEVERLPTAGRARDLHDAWTDGAQARLLEAGTYRVRTDQPDGLLATVVLQPHVSIDAASVAEEREHLERRKGSRIYDTTAWSPLLAAGVDAWWSGSLDGLDWDPVDVAADPVGGLLAGDPQYGWTWSGATDGALAVAAELATRGHRIRVGERPFVSGGRPHPRGSFLARTEENSAELRAALAELAAEWGVEIAPTPTARVHDGPDLGGGHWTLLEAPRIGILAGSPLDFTSVGAAWHLLDHELGVRTSLLDVTQLRRLDLARYNVLVVPNAWGGGDALARALGDDGLGAVRGWVEAGGTLVALAGGAELAAAEDRKLSAVRLRRDVLDDFPAPRFGLGDPAVRALERMQATGLAADGEPVRPAGLFRRDSWPAELGIPGAGSPVLGPGTWALAGAEGVAARRRGPLLAAQADGDAPKGGGAAKGGGEKSGGEKGGEKGGDTKAAPVAEVDVRLRRFMPNGAILRVDLDPEHWLAYGAGDRVAAMAREDAVLIAKDPVRTAARFAAPAELHLGGLLWPEAVGRIAHSAWLTRESQGRGQLILFAGDPNFRGYFWGTERLFLNAVLLGPGLGTTRIVPW